MNWKSRKEEFTFIKRTASIRCVQSGGMTTKLLLLLQILILYLNAGMEEGQQKKMEKFTFFNRKYLQTTIRSWSCR